jgi:hypothetical protein
VSALTPDREGEIREAATRRGRYMDGVRLRDLLSEIDALRSLPVIRTCEDCAWGTVCSVPGTRRCYHPTQLSEAPQVTGAPPEWCPLRGGVSDAPR